MMASTMTSSKCAATVAIAFCAGLQMTAPAQAVIGGVQSRAVDGVRASTLRVETSRGELCSGAAISSELVLTAAHCLMTGGSVRVKQTKSSGQLELMVIAHYREDEVLIRLNELNPDLVHLAISGFGPDRSKV